MIFTDEIVQQVWEKATVVGGNNPNVYRKDQGGAWMSRKEFDNKESDYGWGIEYITPKLKGGSKELYNLRPIQWKSQYFIEP